MNSDPWQIIRSGASGMTGMRRLTLRDLLLVGQIAICAVLVTSSLVAIRGLARSMHSNFGFDPKNVMLVETNLQMGGYTGDQQPVLQKRMLDTVARLPGVSQAAYSSRIPLTLGGGDSFVYTDSTTDYRPTNVAADAMNFAVSPGYFAAAGTTMIAGRDISWHDDKKAPVVAVVSEEFARKVFGSVQKAMGGYFRYWGGNRAQVSEWWKTASTGR